MEPKYYIGDLVWVKLKGYPWWPGVVSKLIYQNIYLDKINYS
jgi:hypothetical protein